MPHVLLATDADWLFEAVDAAIGGPDMTLSRIRSGADVLEVTAALQPDVVILDLQIGNMGGVAAGLSIKLDQRHEGVADTPVLLLLDRRDDVFLARHGEADGWLVKPVDPIRLRAAVDALLAGDEYHEGWSEAAVES